MKKPFYFSTVLMLAIAAGSSYAINYLPGPYIGGQAGWGRIDEGQGYQKWADSQPTRKIHLGTFSSLKGALGYSFIPFFSVEGSYNYYPENNYSDTNNYSINVKTYAIDLVGKVIVPLAILNESLYRLGIYGKFGGAYLNTKINSTIAGGSKKQSNNSIRPTYGFGITFSFTDNIALEGSFSSICGKNRVNSYSGDATLLAANPTPSANLFALGLYYKFTGI